MRRNETQNGMDFISVILTKMKFQTSMRFSCEHNLPETKRISADSLDVAFNAHVRLILNAGMDFISVTDRNEISFRVIQYHVNTTWNEMPTHVHQNVGSLWNPAEMKLHVSRTCFHAGLKSQTGMSSFRLSCERTLSLSTPSCRPQSQNKIKRIGHATAFYTFMILSSSNISHSLTCPKAWGKGPKRLKNI